MLSLGTVQRDAPVQDPSDKGKVLNRTWTISSHPSEQTGEKAFSISVKRVGLISGWLHTSFSQAGVLEWRGVEGNFTPQEHTGPALLIAGGIGELLPLCRNDKADGHIEQGLSVRAPQHCCALTAQQRVPHPAASGVVSIMPPALQTLALTCLHTVSKCASKGLRTILSAILGCCHESIDAPASPLCSHLQGVWTNSLEANPLLSVPLYGYHNKHVRPSVLAQDFAAADTRQPRNNDRAILHMTC